MVASIYPLEKYLLVQLYNEFNQQFQSIHMVLSTIISTHYFREPLTFESPQDHNNTNDLNDDDDTENGIYHKNRK